MIVCVFTVNNKYMNIMILFRKRRCENKDGHNENILYMLASIGVV